MRGLTGEAAAISLQRELTRLAEERLRPDADYSDAYAASGSVADWQILTGVTDVTDVTDVTGATGTQVV